MSDKYITRAELRSDPYKISIDDADNKYLEILQGITYDMINLFCEQDFEQEGAVDDYNEEKIDGTGKDTIFTPKRLLTLEKIRVYSQTDSYTDYTASNFVVKKKYISWNVYSELTGSGRYQVDRFSEGNNNIGIFGIWGWSDYPDAIKYLQGKLIQKMINDKSFANKFSQEKVGDFSYTLVKDEDRITGDFELDLIIKKYRLWSVYGTY